MTDPVRVWQLTPIILKNLQGRPKALPPKFFTERYPKIVYPSSLSKDSRYGDFGFDIEYALVKKLYDIYEGKLILLGDDFPAHLNFSYLSKNDQTKWRPIIDQELEATVEKIAQEYPPSKIVSICHGKTLTLKTKDFEGHPDFIITLANKEVVILDSKVFFESTGKSEDSRRIRVQLALYISLARSLGYRVKKAGIVMPWRRPDRIKIYDVEKWDHSEILALGLEAVGVVYENIDIRERWLKTYSKNTHIGHHQKKGKLAELIKTPKGEARPFQIFLLGNRGKKGEEEPLRKMGDLYEGKVSKHRAYVHAPYSLSLARKRVSPKDPNSPLVTEAARVYIEVSQKMGFKGIVFHIDKSPDLEEAYVNLRKNVKKLLPYISPETPLLLENSCGDGNRFLREVSEFASMISEFPQELVGICFDICHSWGSGYEPSEYLEGLGRLHTRIGLVHLNGAWKKKGCGADGHASWSSKQNISEKEMKKILDYTRSRGVDCIIE